MPPQLAILGEDLAPDIAARVVALAGRHATCPVRELVANGCWSEARYYEALARHLGAVFVLHWPPIKAAANPAGYVSRDRVRLADGTWLVAPEGADLEALCRSPIRRPDIAITTPAHLLALIHRAAQMCLARIAADGLPDAAPNLSAHRIASRQSARVAALSALVFLVFVFAAPRVAGDVFGAIFFTAICLRLLASAGGCAAGDPPPPPLDDSLLPDYSVLVPLHREAEILPHLIAALTALDYPRAKLQVLVLIEPEDHETRTALAGIDLPPWLHVIFGPVGGDLRTKPRALNLGLAAARGSLLTVFDAEDRPEPDQLRRAAARFAAARDLACLQARLTMVAEGGGLLDRIFAIEYSALFDVFNVGLARAGLPIPLGGTSNHFRTATLRDAGGWDAWNVTEDADLGLRFARFGYRVDCLDSTTFETAPDNLRIWMCQRRRWTKGWMQTLLVLVADHRGALRDLRAGKAAVVGLLLVGLVLGPLALPIALTLLAAEFLLYGMPCPRTSVEIAETTLAASVFLLGLGSPLWCGYAGLKASRRLALSGTLPWLLPYQLMISAAAWLGLFDLVFRPFHWHKTPHRPK